MFLEAAKEITNVTTSQKKELFLQLIEKTSNARIGAEVTLYKEQACKRGGEEMKEGCDTVFRGHLKVTKMGKVQKRDQSNDESEKPKKETTEDNHEKLHKLNTK